MYQVIARKYRPQTFSDVVNQEHVKTTLENAIAQKRIAHGYIFSGQRGTGKTTIARILARCLNCVEGPTATPCGECASCKEITAGGTVDVIEIDAASNRGINEMRELRENVRYQPARDRYKVFIIDEAHQITNEAFNALLKTIEEPPPWVVFVLCTTEAHKIPATIASRCQHFSFRSVDFEDLMARMAWICEQEGIETDHEALAVLAAGGRRQRARFAFRAGPGHRLLRREARRGRSARAAGRVLAGVAGEGLAGAARPAIRAPCSKWWTNSSATATTCSISAASWRAISATCWWRGSPARSRAWWLLRPRSGEKLAEIAARLLRGRPDALPATLARSVPGLAVLLAAAVPSGDSGWCGWCRPASAADRRSAGGVATGGGPSAASAGPRRRRRPLRRPLRAARPSPFEQDRAKKAAAARRAGSSGANAWLRQTGGPPRPGCRARRFTRISRRTVTRILRMR